MIYTYTNLQYTFVKHIVKFSKRNKIRIHTLFELIFKKSFSLNQHTEALYLGTTSYNFGDFFSKSNERILKFDVDIFSL